jgi:DinB superfamily
MISKPEYTDAPQYCHYFFDLVKDESLIDALRNSFDDTINLIESISKEKENYSYDRGKWTTNQVIRHIIDCERVYAYRAFRFSRFDDTELAGFDENQYILHTQEIQLNLSELKKEYINVRLSSIDLYEHMTPTMLDFKGKANNVNFTARALACMTVGHNIHHCNFLVEKYL